MNLFFPQINWGGNGPGYVETELQLMPWLTGGLYLIFGEREFLGRLVSLAFMVAAAAAFLGAGTPGAPGSSCALGAYRIRRCPPRSCAGAQRSCPRPRSCSSRSWPCCCSVGGSRRHLRRARPSGDDETVQLGDLELDLRQRKVLVNGQELVMRAKEFDLLERLARDPGSALSRQTLMAEVWNDRWGGSTKTLDVHVASLRKRLSGLPAGTRLPRILTLRGHGYRLEPPGPQRAIGPPSAALQPASNDGRWRRVRTASSPSQ